MGGGAIVGVGSRSLGSLYEGSAFLGSSPNNIDNSYSSQRAQNQKERVSRYNEHMRNEKLKGKCYLIVKTDTQMNFYNSFIVIHCNCP